MNNNDGQILEIKGAIIKVIAFFDMFDYPLTLNEIWLNLSLKCELFEVMEALENEKLEKINLDCSSVLASVLKKKTECLRGNDKKQAGKIIEYKNGFYFLAGREKNIEERLKRYNFTDRKFKRALLVSKIFKFIPWIKMIAVSNLIGAHNLKDNSDIDFFIIAEDKKIWLARWFCAGAAKILGLRPQANNSRDKICLSFYASERALELSGLRLKNYQKEIKGNGSRVVARDDEGVGGNDKEEARDDELGDDIYFIYWLAGLTPLYDVGGMYEKLIKANQWLYGRLPNWQPINPARQRLIKPLAWGFYHDIVNLFFGGLEPQFKKLQLRLLPPQLKNLMNLDSRVVANDQMIKLHVNDRREEYRKKFQEKIKL